MSSLSSTVKSSNNKVKIALPTLCSYGDSDEDDEEKEEEEKLANCKLKNLNPTVSSIGPTAQPASSTASVKKTGLLGILPPPKANAFLKKDTMISTNNKKQAPQSFLLPRTLKSSTTLKSSIQDDEDDKSFKKFKTESPALIESKTSHYQPYKYDKDPDPFGENENDGEDEEDEESFEIEKNSDETRETNEPVSTNPATSSSLLNQEAWLKLCGNKRKQIEPIELMSVNANDIVGDNRAELMKQITDEYKPASAGKDYHIGTGKKRSQITYLAHVARERDQELRNMWSQSKFNKSQARQKYGF